MRDIVLTVALIFCVAFAGMTATVASQSGLDIFTVTSFLIIGLILIAVIGALRDPPR
jgi:hypothetical protein